MGCSSIRVFVIKIKKILRVGSEAVCVCTGTHTLYCSEDDAIKNIENKIQTFGIEILPTIFFTIH